MLPAIAAATLCRIAQAIHARRGILLRCGETTIVTIPSPM